MQRIRQVYFHVDHDARYLPGAIQELDFRSRLPLIAVFGNKTDLVSTPAVPHSELMDFAKDVGPVFFCSALTGSGIGGSFDALLAKFISLEENKGKNVSLFRQVNSL